MDGDQTKEKPNFRDSQVPIFDINKLYFFPTATPENRNKTILQDRNDTI